MRVDIPKPLRLYTDNKQAQSFTTATCLRSRLRGCFSLHEAWVQELKDDGWVEARHVKAEDNAADILTKSLGSSDFAREKRLLSSRWKLFK